LDIVAAIGIPHQVVPSPFMATLFPMDGAMDGAIDGDAALHERYVE